jgi:hypothetical protein
MTPSEMFAVLARAMGLWVLITILETIGSSLPVIVYQYSSNRAAAEMPMLLIPLAAAFWCKALIGFGLFFGANRFASLVYGVSPNVNAATP